MDTTTLSSLVTLLVALSVASERLVEIFKGFIPFLNQKNADPNKEGCRTAMLQVLAVIAGVLTSFVANPSLPPALHFGNEFTVKLFLGLLASGGSGFWNSILTYVSKAKDVKNLEVQEKRKALA